MSKAASRVFSREFKQSLVHRMLSGANVSALACALGVLRKDLYKWRDRFRAHGPDGLRRRCRPLRGNAEAFHRARIVDSSVAIAWPHSKQPNLERFGPDPGDEIDISADAVAALDRAQTMTGPEFRDRLRRLSLSLSLSLSPRRRS